MPKPEVEKEKTYEPQGDSQPSLPVPAVNVVSGAESLLDGNTHVGIAVRVKSSDEPAVLMVPDVEQTKTGVSPVFITRPITLELEKFKKFLENKGVKLPKELENLLKDTSVACNAFYYTAANGPLLLMFSLQFTKGLIASLSGDEDLGDLFDIEGVSVRVFRCPESKFPVLQNYATELSS